MFSETTTPPSFYPLQPFAAPNWDKTNFQVWLIRVQRACEGEGHTKDINESGKRQVTLSILLNSGWRQTMYSDEPVTQTPHFHLWEQLKKTVLSNVNPYTTTVAYKQLKQGSDYNAKIWQNLAQIHEPELEDQEAKNYSQVIIMYRAGLAPTTKLYLGIVTNSRA